MCHRAKDCYNKTNQARVNVVQCFNCNKPGHIAKNCRVKTDKPLTFAQRNKQASKLIQIGSINSPTNECTKILVEETIKGETAMLLDTGADICLIKLNCSKDNTLIDDSHIIELQGIHEQIINTLGRTVLTLRLGNFTKEFYFHVVTNEFKLRTDGVIGRNLLTDLKANIDYSDRTLRIGLNKIPLTNPDIKIPPRSEQVIQVFVNNNGEGLIEELTPGVYITNTIVNVRRNKAQVVLINTTNHEVDASNIHCTLERLDTDVKLIAQSKVEDYLKTDHLRYK